MKIIVFLAKGQVQYESNEPIGKLIEEIYRSYPDNLGFKIVRDEYNLKLRRKNERE